MARNVVISGGGTGIGLATARLFAADGDQVLLLGRRAEVLEAWAVEKLRAEKDLNLVLLGHTHIPRLVPVDGDRFYVNSGDWLGHSTYVVLSPGQPPLLEEWKG